MRVNQGSGRIFAACHWQGSQFLNVGRLKAHHECMLQGSRRIKFSLDGRDDVSRREATDQCHQSGQHHGGCNSVCFC